MRNRTALKSILTVTLTLVMLLGILPISAMAADDYGYRTDISYGDYYNYYYRDYYYRDYDYDRYYSDYYYDYDRYYYNNVNRYNLYYGGYGRYYDDDRYVSSRYYIPNNTIEIYEKSGQVYKGNGSISYTIPDKGKAALTDVIVYPKNNRNKEMVLERNTDYKIETNPLKITFTESFLNSLDNDNYEVIVYFVTGQAYASFSVKY